MSVVFATLWFNPFGKPNCGLNEGQRHIIDFDSGEVFPYCSPQSVKRVFRDSVGILRCHTEDDVGRGVARFRRMKAMGVSQFGQAEVATGTLADMGFRSVGKLVWESLGIGAYVDLNVPMFEYINDHADAIEESPKADHSAFVRGLQDHHKHLLDIWGGVVAGDKPQRKAKIWASSAWMVVGSAYRSEDAIAGERIGERKNDRANEKDEASTGSWRVTDGYWVIIFGAADGTPAKMLEDYLKSSNCQMTYAVAQRSAAARNDGNKDGTVGSSDVGFGSRLVEALQCRSAALAPIADLRDRLRGVRVIVNSDGSTKSIEESVVETFRTWASLAPHAPTFRKGGD